MAKKKSKKRKKPPRPRSPLLRDFFASGLSRKSHPHKPETAYDRRRLKQDLEQREEDADKKS